ncbi:M17 family metallopeptidase [Fluviispira vulneris]|uniref:M17 family metallopeptidase n=1 Tax=Fluviispira vulneris TaxID=2763012 RepID=UPI001645DDCD|nr:leucyl aminopeptidase family protein [Fluviispira vulneris]
MKTRVTIDLLNKIPVNCETVFNIFCEDSNSDIDFGKIIEKYKEAHFIGKVGDKKTLSQDNQTYISFGAGSTAKNDNLSGFRKAIGKVISEAKEQNLHEIIVEIIPSRNTDINYIAYVFAETVTLALYSFEHIYSNQSFPQKKMISVENIKLKFSLKNIEQETILNSIAKGINRGQSLNFARYLSDLPANQLRPKDLVTLTSEQLSKFKNIQTTLLDKSELEKQGFGGIIAVGKGSVHEPYLAIFDYNPPNAKKTVVVIGKGVTFDTGGYSIKGKKHHNEMKYDMSGAANVFSAAYTAAAEEIPIRVISMIVCVENAIGDHAQRPSDVYKAWNGKLVDVFNTDAEGRLILADAIAFSASFAPSLIVDIATLTGGASQIAGNLAAILCSNNEQMIGQVKEASALAGEKFVHLEILPEAIENIKGTVSDFTNMNNKWSEGAATMHAAAFLQAFVPNNTDWVHFDIANVSENSKDNGYLAPNSSAAYGARTIVNLLEKLAEN